MGLDVANEYGKVINMGEVKYVKDGDLYTGRTADAVMVEDEDDLTGLTGILNPGSIAFTAGYKEMWQLAADGTWVDMLEAETTAETT